MTGAGIFINTTELAKRAGVLGALSYIIVSILLLPLVLSFVKLAEVNPTGGFFSFSAHSLAPVVGFLSTWSYFIAKLSSATLVIHVFITIMQKTIPALAQINTFALDGITLSIILGLNMFNVQTGSKIQGWLMMLKIFPIVFVLLSGLFFLNGAHLLPLHHIWSGVPSTIPLVLHAMLGFEAACSISRNLQNPQKDGPRVILFSYAIVVALCVLYQTFFYGILGTTLAKQANYSWAFPLLVNHYLVGESIQTMLAHFIHIAIATSAVSAAFGTIYTNMWNLFVLAEQGYTFMPNFIMQRNKYKVPFICVLIQGAISLSYMFIIRGDHVTFQQLSALGCTVNYALCILGLFATLYTRKQNILIPTLALVNCAILLGVSFYTMWWSNNSKPLYIFTSLTLFALLMFRIRSKKLITTTTIPLSSIQQINIKKRSQ